MKLCKDCRYFSHRFEDERDTEPFCFHSMAKTNDDPIWGNHSRRTCKVMRNALNDGILCGKMGNLWIAAADFTPTDFKETI